MSIRCVCVTVCGGGVGCVELVTVVDDTLLILDVGRFWVVRGLGCDVVVLRGWN